jgi:dihydropteroate synthase
MGIVNVTPDSFSGRWGWIGDAQRRFGMRSRLQSRAPTSSMSAGESTRPGAAFVPPAEEMRRVLPVIEALVQDAACVVSVDTR